MYCKPQNYKTDCQNCVIAVHTKLPIIMPLVDIYIYKLINTIANYYVLQTSELQELPKLCNRKLD